MSDYLLEENPYFKYLKDNLNEQLSRWVGPNWIVCIPEKFELDFHYIPILAASQALTNNGSDSSQYYSELCGASICYEMTEDDPRKIIWQDEKNSEVIISEANIITEYLTPFQGQVLHVVLVDRLLPSMLEDDESFLLRSEFISLSSNAKAEMFLQSFKCHYPVLQDLKRELEEAKPKLLSSSDVYWIQCFFHGIILDKWSILIKRHIPDLQADSSFQDLMYRALDFFTLSICHNELWNHIVDRCRNVDGTVSARIKYLKSCDISPMQLGVCIDHCTPLPAAVVEMATLNARLSAMEKLHCVQDSFQFIEAQTKEANALVWQFRDADTNEMKVKLTQDDLTALMMIVVIQSQCTALVANIYYMTHFVFSITDEADCLWQGLCLLRLCLERIMKLNLTCLRSSDPEINYPLRKELSLQDLMQVSTDIESRLDRKIGSFSASDITTLDLQMHQLTQRIHKSTQALSERNSPSRHSERVTSSTLQTQSHSSRTRTFLEFLSYIPSTIRESFRRKQTEHKSGIQSSVQP